MFPVLSILPMISLSPCDGCYILVMRLDSWVTMLKSHFLLFLILPAVCLKDYGRGLSFESTLIPVVLTYDLYNTHTNVQPIKVDKSNGSHPRIGIFTSFVICNFKRYFRIKTNSKEPFSKLHYTS